MQQRRVRLGDILDDYCPRERRITNHAVVAMIDETVKQTRCTTCDAEHEFKDAKIPLQRRRKPEGVLVAKSPLAAVASAGSGGESASSPDMLDESLADGLDADALDEAAEGESLDATSLDAESLVSLDAMPQAMADDIVSTDAEPMSAAGEDEWPVHRPLIRATLPRPEGHTPERKEVDFTMRAPGRFDNRGGQRHGRGRPAQGQSGGGQFGSGSGGGGGQRQGGGFQGERNGNRAPNPQGRGGRNGQNRGVRNAGPGQGQGRGPKRGR